MDNKNNSLEASNFAAASASMDVLCHNSIELIQYARKIAVNQVNIVQLMTYYALGRWIVEEQQAGEVRPPGESEPHWTGPQRPRRAVTRCRVVPPKYTRPSAWSTHFG